MSHQQNITRIKAVYNALGELKDQVVFVGGATVSLYADRIAPEVRPTDDVDVLIEIGTRWDYAVIEEKLRKIGFKNDTTSKFLGRYLLPGIVVDVMPIDEEILGFSNKWYTEGFQTAVEYRIDDRHSVKIFDTPHFIASKIEAFKNRGHGDGRMSDDFEDIIFVFENRSSVWKEMNEAPSLLKEYLLAEFNKLKNNPHIEEWIDAHSDFHSPPGGYYIMQDIDDFLKTK